MVHSSWQLDFNSPCSGPDRQSGLDSGNQLRTTTVQDAFSALAAGGQIRERRRRSPRYPSSAAIRLAWTSSFDKYAIGVCVDISRNGLGMLISDSIPVLTKVCFKSDSLALSGSGTVRHCKKQKAKYIVGLDFVGGLRWVNAGECSTGSEFVVR